MGMEAGDRARHAVEGHARSSGFEDLILELSRVREALGLFPSAWEGAAAVHREAARLDALVQRLQRATGLSRDFVQAATSRLSLLLENGASPQVAMHLVLREAISERFAPGGSAAPAPPQASAPVAVMARAQR